MNTENNKNSRRKIIIIIVAATIVLAITGFIFYKAIDKFTGDDEVRTPANNVTIFSCHMLQTLSDSDIDRIEKIAKSVAGDKFIDIDTKGIPLTKASSLTDINGEKIEAGDKVRIIFSVLTETELNDVIAALIKEYKLDEKLNGDDIGNLMERYNMYRAEYDGSKK